MSGPVNCINEAYVATANNATYEAYSAVTDYHRLSHYPRSYLFCRLDTIKIATENAAYD